MFWKSNFILGMPKIFWTGPKTTFHYWISPSETYHKVASSNTSRFEAHAGLFKLLRGFFLWPFGKKYFWICNPRYYSTVYETFWHSQNEIVFQKHLLGIQKFWTISCLKIGLSVSKIAWTSLILKWATFWQMIWHTRVNDYDIEHPQQSSFQSAF